MLAARSNVSQVLCRSHHVRPRPPTPPRSFIILKYMDLITIAVPPALPACLTVATAIAVARLQARAGETTGLGHGVHHLT